MPDPGLPAAAVIRRSATRLTPASALPNIARAGQLRAQHDGDAGPHRHRDRRRFRDRPRDIAAAGARRRTGAYRRYRPSGRARDRGTGGKRVGGLVNGAGWDRIQPFMENPPEMWERLIAINLLGAVRLSRAVLPPMIAAQQGKIVNISSDAGRVGSMGETVYAAAKGGIIAFTKSLARE